MDFLHQAASAYHNLPPKMKASIYEEAQNLGVDTIQYFAGKMRQGIFGNSTYTQQQQGAKRSRTEAAKDKSCTIIPAQLRMGRGAELSYQQQNILPAIKFKTGESVGRPVVSAYARERMLYKPQTASTAFAYKMQLEPPSFLSSDDSVPVNRFVVHNVFRHVLCATQNISANSIYGKNTISWNNTLGPDKSYVRRPGALDNGDPAGTGSAYSAPPVSSGLNTSLQSPYRYPANGEFMYSRMSRRLLENLGWNANPIKIAAINSGPGSTTTTANLQVYPNAAQSQGVVLISAPNQAPPDTGDSSFGASYFYRSQMTRGELSYNFSNEGTNPLVVDIVITRIKKGNALIKRDFIDSLVETYQQGYLNYSYANKNQADFQGQPPVVEDVTTNARGPFLPAKALDNYKLTVDPTTGSVFQQSAHPYKQVARDQFIVAGGATRAWSMYLQGMDYDARKYAQYNEIDLPVDKPIIDNDLDCSCVDDLTYIISIGMSGVPAPYIEQPVASGVVTAPLTAVIDRRGTETSCSVTGLYKEHCHPVYLSMSNNETYVNGKLDIAHYDTGAAPVLGTADILSIANATRGSAESSALIAMGPLNTVGGG